MKIYLLNPPFIKNYIRGARCTYLPVAGSSWYPIFLAYATGAVEKRGHQVKLVDATLGDWDLEKVLKDIEEFKPDYTVIYISHDSFESDINVTKKIKEIVETKTIFVGPWAAFKPDNLVAKYPMVDMVIRREFEWPLAEIADGKPLSEIGWLNWRGSDGKVVNNPDGEFMDTEKLDSLPFVSDIYRRHLDIKLWRQSSLKYPFVDLLTARGCTWGKCTFCLWPQTIHRGAKYRARSIGNVIEEIKFIKEKMPEVKEIFFQDDTMPASRMKELSQAILDNGLNITWSGYARADSSFTYDILKLAKKSGLRFLHIGFESGCQEILNNMKKGVTLEEMEVFTKIARKAGINLHSNFIFGLPGETKETICQTIEWAKNLKLSDYQFFGPQPHQATDFYYWAKEKGYLTDDGKNVNYPGLTSEEIEEWVIKAYKRIYLSPTYILARLKDSILHPSEFIRLFKVAVKGLPRLFNKKINNQA